MVRNERMSFIDNDIAISEATEVRDLGRCIISDDLDTWHIILEPVIRCDPVGSGVDVLQCLIERRTMDFPRNNNNDFHIRILDAIEVAHHCQGCGLTTGWRHLADYCSESFPNRE